MNFKAGSMMSRDVLLWRTVFDQFDKRDNGFPVSVDQFSNMLAGHSCKNPDDKQRGNARCVALFLHNNYLWKIKPDALAKPIGIRGGEKAPCWRLERWIKAFSLHAALMKTELAELEAMEVCS